MGPAGRRLRPPPLTEEQIAILLAYPAPLPEPSWTDQAKAELHLLSINLHAVSGETAAKHPCLSTILEGYAKRIDELMKDAPR